MERSDGDRTCPSCGTPATSRFCGHCGALVRPRDRAPVPEDADAPRVRPAVSRRRRGRIPVTVAVVLAVSVGWLVRPAPETPALEASVPTDDGSRRATDDAVTDLSLRWSVPWSAAPAQPADLAPALTDLGPLVVLRAGSETVGLLRPERLAAAAPRRPGINLGGELDPVLWRLPAIAGTPALVAGRLPVLAGDELLWLAGRDAAIAGRTELQGLDGPVPDGPAFATPAGGLLVGGEGPVAITAAGDVRWRGPGGTVVGVAGGTVVLRTATRGGVALVGLDAASGAERWRGGAGPDDRLGVALVGDVVVLARPGGALTFVDAVAGGGRGDVRLGPAPATLRDDPDGETTILGVAGGDVLVRVDTPVGIRAYRVTPRSPDPIVVPLAALADRDVRTASGAWAVTADGPPALVALGDDRRSLLPPIDRTPMAEPVGPAVAGERVLIPTAHGIATVDLTTGVERWRADVGAWGCCARFLTRGAVAVPGTPSVLEADGRRRWGGPAEPDADARVLAATGDWLVVAEHRGGREPRGLLLAADDGSDGPTLDVVPRQAVTDEDGLVVLGSAGSPVARTEVVAYDVLRAGEGARATVRWRRPVAVASQLVRSGDELLVIGPATVEHLDRATGERRGRTPLPRVGLLPATVTDGWLVRRTDAHTLEGVHLATGQRWSRSFASALTGPPSAAGPLVYLADRDSVVYALGAGDGRTVASVTVPDRDVHSLTVVGGVLLAGGAERLHAFGPPSDRSTLP